MKSKWIYVFCGFIGLISVVAIVVGLFASSEVSVPEQAVRSVELSQKTSSVDGVVETIGQPVSAPVANAASEDNEPVDTRYVLPGASDLPPLDLSGMTSKEMRAAARERKYEEAMAAGKLDEFLEREERSIKARKEVTDNRQANREKRQARSEANRERRETRRQIQAYIDAGEEPPAELIDQYEKLRRPGRDTSEQ